MARRWSAAGALLLGAWVALSSIPATASTTPTKPRTAPELKSNAFYVLDESGSKVLAARNEKVAVPIASITKLMTALVVVEAQLPLSESLSIDQAVIRNAPDVTKALAGSFQTINPTDDG